jgi:hypothetical protein
VEDALSRRVYELHATTISMYRIDIKGRILEAANVYLQYMELVAKIQQGEMPKKVENYKLGTDGTLMYKNTIYIPNF